MNPGWIISSIHVEMGGIRLTICELHRLCTSSAELAGHDDLAALGTRLHNETEHTIARTNLPN